MNKEELTKLIDVICSMSGFHLEEKIKDINFIISIRKIKRVISENVPLIPELSNIIFEYYREKLSVCIKNAIEQLVFS